MSHWQFLLSGVVADTIGVLLTLVWTASFLPSFLDPQAASVLLVKPTSRATLLVSRFVGVVLYVAMMAAIFVAATWIAMGIRTGEWNLHYWISVPLLVGHFAVFFAFSALLAVMSRNTTVCIVGTLLFWLLCWAMNYGRHVLSVVHLQEASAGLGRLTEIGYWLLPKPLDFSLLLADAFGTEQTVAQWLNLRSLREANLFQPMASVVSSLAAGAVLLGLAVYEFIHDEY
jgi:ABC-type transport system involved in multi-copper enzyme maturation permease subunit